MFEGNIGGGKQSLKIVVDKNKVYLSCHRFEKSNLLMCCPLAKSMNLTDMLHMIAQMC